MVREPERPAHNAGAERVIIRAAWVAPIATPPIRDGFVEISGGVIVRVGHARQLERRAVDCDLGRTLITPGLVNPHTHLELTGYAGMIEPAPFWRWIEKLIGLRREFGRRERERQGAADGAWQSLRAGVTCVGDISRENVSWAALKTVPIRKVCFVELLSLADEPPRNPAELRAAVAEVEEDDLLTAGVTPHAPYTVPGEQIRAAVALAHELKRPWCTHWAETVEEVAFVRGDLDAIPTLLRMLLQQCGVHSPACSPGEYLEHCAAGLTPGLLAHANYLDESDIAGVAASGHTVAYCPRAHAFFGHDPHPFPRLCAAGATVTIGTDSAASNQDLSLLRELQFIRRNFDAPPKPEVLLRMATVEAAAALGLGGRIGSLEAGKAADLAAFPCSMDATDPVAELIDGAPAPTAVWVAGQRVI